MYTLHKKVQILNCYPAETHAGVWGYGFDAVQHFPGVHDLLLLYVEKNGCSLEVQCDATNMAALEACTSRLDLFK